MRVTYGQVAVRQAIDAKEMPQAGPVRTYRIEEEFETKIARNLQTIIRIGKPQMRVELEARQEAIREIVIACMKELEKEWARNETTEV